ncbi:hypothetical protein BKX95_08415 [Streptococcus iniae]|nr:hypothetical protein BKX95_08415 [Streptococcus iniae]
MKIEEAKIRFEEIETYTHGFYDDVLIKKRDAKVILDQLNQPKPEVPQFVAEWIEICDMRFVNLNYIFGENCPKKVKEWVSVYGNHKKMLQALLYDYTVKKEKLYTVEIPNPNRIGFVKHVLLKDEEGNVRITLTSFDNWEEMEEFQLTEQQIRKDFDWAWQQGFQKEVTE